MTELLRLDGVVKHHRVPDGVVHAVDGVSFSLSEGEVLGLVGESGCGKSTLGRTMLRLEELNAGSIVFEGRDISALRRRELRPVRRQMQMVFQDPYASLNPRGTVRRILTEPFIVHGIGSREERRRWVDELLTKVGLRPEQADLYPHQFSGGQRQRISIARALALRPKLVVCDEPVSALDVSIQAQILNLLSDLRREFGLAYVFISHDLAVVGHIADRIAVMYLGQIVEIGARAALWADPKHPYTRALFSALPSPHVVGRPQARVAAKGEPASPLAPPSGCRFHTRCPLAADICRTQAPALRALAPGQMAACHFAQ